MFRKQHELSGKHIIVFPWVLSVCSSLSSRARGDVWTLVGFAWLLHQDFSNAFVNLWNAVSFLGALWQGVSQFNCKLSEEPLYIAVTNLAFASFISCPLVLVFRKARKPHSWFTFSTALVISQPSVSALPSLHAGSTGFPVKLQAFYCPYLNLPYSWKHRQCSHKITGCQIFRYASQLVCAYIWHVLGSNDLCKCGLPVQLFEHFQHHFLNGIWLFNPVLKGYPFGEFQSNTHLSLISVWQTGRIQANQNQTPGAIQTFKLL